MKRLLIITACAVLLSVNAGASLIPTQPNNSGMDQVVTTLVFSVPAGETATQRVKVHYEMVNSMIAVDYTVSIMFGGAYLSVAPIPPATKFTTNMEIEVSVNTAGLPVGSIPGATIQFIESGIVRGSVDVDPTVTEALPRTAGVSRTSIDETVAPGEKKDVNLEITSDVDTSLLSANGKGIPSFAIGEVDWTAVVTLLNEPGTNWFTISPTSGTAARDNPSQVTATVDATQLPGPGTYQAEIAVASNPTVIVPVTVVVRPSGPRLSLSQNAVLFQPEFPF